MTGSAAPIHFGHWVHVPINLQTLHITFWSKLYFNYLFKEFLEQMIPYLKALI